MIHRRSAQIPQIVQGRFDAGVVMAHGVDGGVMLLRVVSVVFRGRAQRTPVVVVLLLWLAALVAEREEPAAVAHAVVEVGRI